MILYIDIFLWAESFYGIAVHSASGLSVSGGESCEEWNWQFSDDRERHPQSQIRPQPQPTNDYLRLAFISWRTKRYATQANSGSDRTRNALKCSAATKCPCN